MTHTFTTNLGLSNFYTALITDGTTVLKSLVFTAETFIILYRSEDLGTEQTVAFRLESTVVDGFRLLNFAVRP